MYIYIYICIYTYIHTIKQICIHTYIDMCIHIYIYIYIVSTQGCHALGHTFEAALESTVDRKDRIMLL